MYFLLNLNWQYAYLAVILFIVGVVAMVLVMMVEPMALHMVRKCSTTETYHTDLTCPSSTKHTSEFYILVEDATHPQKLKHPQKTNNSTRN